MCLQGCHFVATLRRGSIARGHRTGAVVSLPLQPASASRSRPDEVSRRMMNTGGNGSNNDRFEETYRKYYGRVLRYYRSCRIADDEASDLAQDTFKRLWERWSTIRGEDPWPFLKQIARSILLNYIRASRTQKRTAPLVDIDDPELFIDPPAPPEQTYEDREDEQLRREALYRAFRELTKGQQDCLRLQIQDFSYDEIQKTLGITPDAVKSRIRDAKRSLRERLGEKR
ncbi:MAG TPA: sigma-70 family RNA polymerase sigma factor [Thermoanaerobaculia bacterium]